MVPLVRKAGALSEYVHASKKIGMCLESTDEPVQMIWHEDVRNYFDTVLRRCTQEFIARSFDDAPIFEGRTTVQRTHREEDAMRTDVERRIEFARAAMFHAGAQSKPRAALA